MRSIRRRLESCAWWLVLFYLLAALFLLILTVLRLILACARRRPRPEGPAQTATIPDFAHRQPDPLIYSQFWLQKHSLAVTWDNPDIHLESVAAPGVAVDSHLMAPATDYRIVARIWNGSPNAPVADLPIDFSYIDFGIGGASVPIAVTKIDLPVKGAAGTPAIATVKWTTPPQAGHFCIQVRIVWPFDADPDNNLGQHNVDVQPLNSPRAKFTVPVRNTGKRPLTMRLMSDSYAIPRLRPCPPDSMNPEERERVTRRDHDPQRHRLPVDWIFEMEGADEQAMVALHPQESRNLAITVTAPEGFRGRQAFNLHGFDGGRLIGGVTLYAEGDADG